MFTDYYEPKKSELPLSQEPFKTTDMKEDFHCALACSAAQTYNQRYTNN